MIGEYSYNAVYAVLPCDVTSSRSGEPRPADSGMGVKKCNRVSDRFYTIERHFMVALRVQCPRNIIVRIGRFSSLVGRVQLQAVAFRVRRSESSELGADRQFGVKCFSPFFK